MGDLDEPHRSLAPQRWPTAFVGLENYRRLAADPAFWRADGPVVFATVTCAVKRRSASGSRSCGAPVRGRALVFMASSALGVPGERERHRLVLDAEPADPHGLQRVMGNMKFAVDSALGGAQGVF